MIIVFSLIIFILGAAIGSFIAQNVYRDTGDFKKEDLLHKFDKRSRCDKCFKQIKNYHLIPILSYIFLKGKCSHCGSKIPVQFFTVEVLTGFSFLAITYFSKLFFFDSILAPVLLLIFISTLIYLTYEDYREMYVSSRPLYILFFISILFNFIYITDLLDLLLVTSLFVIVFTLRDKIEKYIGVSDIIVFLSIYLVFGSNFFIHTLLYSVWIGAAVSIFIMYQKYGSYKRGMEISFFPFILAGLLLNLLLLTVFDFQIFKIKDILMLIS